MNKTRETYHNYLNSFLSASDRNICPFKGSWGIGKTYFWKEFIKNNSLLNEFRAYSYVSLFGLNDLSQIKEEIFANTKSTSAKWDNFNKSDAIKKASSISKKLPFLKDYQGLISHFENSYIRNFIICFDDIERRSDKINLKTFLGFCNQLREESNCKILIILNEDEVLKKKKDAKQLNKYREKVVDLELLFQPTLLENYYLIFGDDTKFKSIFNTLEGLGIVNLRILQRIKWNLEYFDTFLNNCESAVIQYFNQRITLISYFILTGNSNKNDGAIFKSIDDEFNDTLLEKKTSILSKYNYFFEPNDKIIIDYVTNYKFDENKFRSYVNEINEKEKQSQIRSKINIIWDEYRANFKLLPQEFQSKLEGLLKEQLKFLTQSDLEAIINILNKLDNSFDESFWWEKYVEQHLVELDIDTLKSLKPKINNSSLQGKIERKIDESYLDLSIKDVIYHIVNNNSWSHHHVKRLKLAEENDYYTWLLEEDDDRLLYIIKSFMETFRPSTPNEDYKDIGIKLVHALNRIAKIDKLKELRVRELLNIK